MHPCQGVSTEQRSCYRDEQATYLELSGQELTNAVRLWALDHGMEIADRATVSWRVGPLFAEKPGLAPKVLSWDLKHPALSHGPGHR